ncbi:putative ATP-dependent RNA helicase DDX11-like protein 8 isoform X2 [Hordeum vulgare subsp. vulgare]|uniref:putative ATP-dependent RNA helicase DDX11-like protein 8 isoform X2 n=1 Tax=Hordeum vulgare subsp. vulgare TaxID=112509 RepID=UPI001D1A523B|nr:putative ATP-dependent RNA helicase DDX11-like protein 8 isoform X2 [Hordeum vulgare subsp. vulgare]
MKSLFGRKPSLFLEKVQGQHARETPNPPHQRALDEMPPPPPPPRQDFPAFPFAPYPIQSEFMSFLYSALSSGPRALALLESPTGTGKTLSIICSALQWLLDHRDAASRGHPERANGSGPAAVGGEDDEPEWMRDFTLQPLPPKKDIRKKSEIHPSRKQGTRKMGDSEKSEGIRENGGEEEFLLDEYESDDGEGTGRQPGKRAHCGGASSSSEGEDVGDEEEEEEATPKVYFTSRTHSQLSQFVRELKRTDFSGKLRTVCLGSRKSLCINMDVQKLGSANRINERCLELLNNKKSSKIKVEGDNKKGRRTKTSCRCPMLGNRSLQKQFRSEVSDHGALDIEDLAQIGRKIGTCPYYGARDMVRSADLVVLPYQSLLLKSARESLGLNLKNSVVIIDEAHNLADSLTSMYNSKVESSQVSGYANKLFITENGGGNLNHGQPHGEGSSITSFQDLTAFLSSLLYCNDDGRIIVARHKPGGQPEDAYIKFVMLCAEKTFSEVTDDAHAVIMAGGTLQPIEETRLRLFPGLLPSDIKFFSCNHIVPPESILPIAVTCGPSGKKFDFSHSSRSSPNMIEELGRFLCNIVTIVPEGIVMFFSSYEYGKQVYDAWMASGAISKISKKKHVFREPRSSVDVEVILNKYKEAIQSCSKGSGDASVNGALLLAVVGGKISEGINFSDGMGRCVLMVGLPYPSPDDIELMETIKHIGNYSTSSVVGDDKPFSRNDECKLEPGFDVLRKSGKSGREYYENLCMKAVNQSIGRAIRHVNDYAAMLLVDSRYAHTSSSRGFSCPVEKLPQWIKARLTCGQNYGEVHRLLHQFFKINKQIH